MSELLQGETLRSRLQGGPLALRKAVEYAIQIAQGLDVAHAHGVVHRDLKPENLFLTREGRIKILDFGLAKLTHIERAGDSGADIATGTTETAVGSIVGTVGYMAPEQVRGLRADARSDLFAFGVVLYEMLCGQRAFARRTAVETLSAILNDEPPSLVETLPELPPLLEHIVRRCLEKDPEARLQSARDLAFELELVQQPGMASGKRDVEARPGWLRGHRPLLLTAVAVAGVALGILATRALQRNDTSVPSFRQLTFQRGTIFTARFAPDGQTIVYSATWDGKPVDVYATRLEFPETRTLGIQGSNLLSISHRGEMAILRDVRYLYQQVFLGTLARASLAGGAPRDILAGVRESDWAPGGEDLAVVVETNNEVRLEYPSGHVLYRTTGWISHPRFSPRGDRIAFLDHPLPRDDRGSLLVVDLEGRATTLATDWSSAEGLAWSPRGDEILVGAAQNGAALSLYWVSLAGRQRVALRIAGRVTPCDLSSTGDLLITRDSPRVVILGQAPGARVGARSFLVRSVGSRGYFAGWQHDLIHRVQ